VRRINPLRFWGVSAFVAPCLVRGALPRTGNLELFAVYWTTCCSSCLSALSPETRWIRLIAAAGAVFEIRARRRAGR
jgi:hypothetical protein